MKTAIQDLIERYYLFENGEYKPDAFKKHFAEFYPLHLLKEKEQIIDAWKSGNKYLPYENPNEYYNQTYNQKQHIIDIMKADEDDGLYNQNES
jgi:hypothetical protein